MDDVMIATGERLDERFVIGREVGRGGSSVVFEAVDEHQGALVAVKVLLGDGNPRRFAREATLLAGLDHPAIIAYIAHGATGERLYLVQEWIDGLPLATHLDRTGLTIGESVALVHRIASGLAVAHGIGIVHRDIKPDNILLPDSDLSGAKLIDFGIAHDPASDLILTATGVAIGTPGYMAPEQMRDAKSVDAHTDVFALGCVLFECLTGRILFHGEEPLAIFTKIMVMPIPDVRDYCAEAPPALVDVVASMLRKDPGQRPADAGAVVACLAPFLSLEGETRRPVMRVDSETIDLRGSSASEDSWAWLVIAAPPDRFTADDAVLLRERLLADETWATNAEVSVLDDASAIVALTSDDDPAFAAERALACAVDMRSVFPEVEVALCACRSSTPSAWSALIDQTVALIAEVQIRAAGEYVAQPPAIRLDAHCADHLRRSVELREDDVGAFFCP